MKKTMATKSDFEKNEDKKNLNSKIYIILKKSYKDSFLISRII